MKCVKCNHEMTKFVYNNIIIDQCSFCGGIWLDKKEFYTLIQKLNKNYINKNIERFQKSNPSKSQMEDISTEKYIETFFVKIDNKNNKNCPKCGNEQLINIKICDKIIDMCNGCGGMFFDKLEFEQIYLQIYHQQSFWYKLITNIKSFKREQK